MANEQGRDLKVAEEDVAERYKSTTAVTAFSTSFLGPVFIPNIHTVPVMVCTPKH